MGDRGPIGKRSAERQRTNKPDIPIEQLDVTDILKAEVTKPVANEKWHPVARRWFDSLAESAQVVYYEPSDWAVAYLVAESISRDFEDQFLGISEETGEPIMGKIPLKGASLSAYAKIFSALMMTEGDRRRAQLEIERTSANTVVAEETGTSDITKRRNEAVGNG